MKGEVVYLYAFDVANEIVTAKVREILSEKPFPFEIRMERTLPKDMPLHKPLAIQPPFSGRMGGQPVQLLVRVYDVGVVTVMMRVPFEARELCELLRFHEPKLENGESLDRSALTIRAEVCKSLKDYMRGATDFLLPPEAYTVFCLSDLGSATDANAWLAENRRDAAGLLTETDANKLSEAQVTEALRIQRSYENTDLAVIDWDAALVVDLTGYTDDVLYALELANLQLEEFRTMDHRLDQYLERAYKDLEQARVPLFGAANATLRRLRRFRMDVTKLADEVTHITKFFGDWHLARVYLGARDRFYLDQWRTSVEQRLAQLDKLYTVAHTEMNEQRMLILELLIVIFFAIDIAMLLFGRR